MDKRMDRGDKIMLWFFVNVYLIDRAYGGPEEGGWWFQTGQLIRMIPCRERDVERLQRRVRRVVEAWNEGRRPISSVLSTGVYAMEISEEPGADYPTEQPYYS